MERKEADSRLMTPELRRVLLVGSSWSFAHSAFYLLPKFLEQSLSAGPAAIGLVVGMFGWATVGVAPIAGRLLETRSARSACFLGAMATAVTTVAFVGVGDVGPFLLALRVLQALAHALVFTAIGVAVSELVRVERLSEALGISGASMLVMNAASPAILEPLADRAGWDTVFVVAAVVSCLSALLALRLPATGRRRVDIPDGGFIALLRRPLGRDFAIVSAISGLAFGTVFAFEPTLALRLGRESVGGFFVAYAIGAIGVRLGLGRLPDRIGRHAVATAMLVLYSLTVASLAFTPAWLLEGVGFVFGIAHGLFYPSLNGLVLATVEPARRGRLFALFTAAFYLGFAGPSLLGIVADSWGLDVVFVAIGGTTAIGAVILARSTALRSPARPSEERSAVEPPMRLPFARHL
jgi:MFS family permease